jgi:hypothetical protein
MTIRERMEAFWTGGKPDRIPYTVCHWEWRKFGNDPAWLPMYREGLGVTYQVPSVIEEVHNVEYENKTYTENGVNLLSRSVKTPVGELFSIESEGWHRKYMLETAEDYRVMKYIAENTKIKPCYDKFIMIEKDIAPYGIPMVQMGRTPIQTILVDYVGLENFSYHLLDFEEELMDLYFSLLKNCRKKVQMIAEGPGKFVSVLENFTAESMGPARFGAYHVPVYNELFPILKSSGKIVGTHYDGRLLSCRELIASSPMDIIESLTEPPEGDMSLGFCRQSWPDKLFWCNINVSAYDLPRQKLKERVLRLVEEGADHRRKLAFEVSEQLPVNWRESMPMVLETLKERGEV